MQQRAAEQVRRDIIRICHGGLDSRTLRVEVIKRLRKVIPFDASFFATADPATLLFTGAVVDEALQNVTPQFLANEFLQDDVNKFARLARGAPLVGSLMQATRHDMESSPRFREILSPLALGDELRVALITSTVCWGFLCLHRDRSDQPFSAAEATFLTQLTSHLAEGLCKALLLGRTMQPPTPNEPGILLLADDFSVAAITPIAERWLTEVAEADWPRSQALPQAVYAAAIQLQALERDAPEYSDRLPKARLYTASGHWLVLHASRLAGPSTQGQIAIIIEMARPAEIAPLIVQAYDLSPREGEIVQLVVCGQSTAEIATTFQISSNTVQDHLKAIFEKFGVRSRRELVGSLFAQQYQPRIAAGRDLDTKGWFI